MNLPVWKCKACGCLWRDNLDGFVSLLNAEQKSCATCEHSPTREACAIHWLQAELAADYALTCVAQPGGPDQDRTASADGDAAAPDLLAALHRINVCACYTQEDASPENREAMLQEIGRVARAAIAKAEGRS